MTALAALEERQTRTADRVELVALDLIDPAADNPRRQLGDLTELAQSITSIGLLEPLVVTPREERYLLVCGGRRHAATVQAGLDAVTCVIREFTETERQEAMLIENLQRVDLAVLEEAESYRRLVELGYTQRQLAQRVGRSQAHVSKRLALLELPSAVRRELDSGGITLEDAQQLGRLTAHPKRLLEAFGRRKEWGGLARRVDEQLDEVKVTEKVERETAAIRKAGLTLLQMKRDGVYQVKAPSGTAVVERDSWSGVDMKPSEHAKLDCHAVAVDPRTGERVHLCRKPDTHGKPLSGRSSTQETAKAKKWREHEKALRAARDARRAAAAAAVKALKPTTRDGVTAIIVDALIARGESEAEKVALALLGLEPKMRKGGYGEYADREWTLYDAAGKSPADAARVGIALALATDEIRLSINTWSSAWESDRAKAYYELLAKYGGFTPSPAEKLELAGKGPRP